MRLIRVTDSAGTIYNLDIDNETAIGIDFQAYDFKEPGKRKINISNTFTVPATIHNLRTFGYPGNVHTSSKRFYDKWYIDYWIDNVQFVTNARLRIEQVDTEKSRISLFIFEKPDIWEQFKLLLWPDFVREFLIWMRDEKGLPVASGTPPEWTWFDGDMETFLNQYNDNTEGIILTRYFGNLATYQPFGSAIFIENEWELGAIFGTISLYKFDQDPDNIDNKIYAEGGHFSIFVKTIFEFMSILSFNAAGI
jgi:hypothetical protein